MVFSIACKVNGVTGGGVGSISDFEAVDGGRKLGLFQRSIVVIGH